MSIRRPQINSNYNYSIKSLLKRLCNKSNKIKENSYIEELYIGRGESLKN